MKIAIAGTGYVGLSLAILLSQYHSVIAVDIIQERIDMINHRISPIRDEHIEQYITEKNLNLFATMDVKEAFTDADFVIIAVPTNYDSQTNSFDTSKVESVLRQVIAYNPNAVIIIKSTVPVGFTAQMSAKYQPIKLMFSPEFLRESKALYDNLYPSRIVVGTDISNSHLLSAAQSFATLLQACALKPGVEVLIMGSTEAEAVKLFSNTYLALRVSFFNELDTFAEIKGLNTREIIEGVCLDPRIGMFYNNPSFGYGGYCLPKDTKQLLADYQSIPENLIWAAVQSNSTRKEYITTKILELAAGNNVDSGYWFEKAQHFTIGVYKLAMKTDSDNYRDSAIHDVMKRLLARGAAVIVYEPSLQGGTKYYGCLVVSDLLEFKKMCDIIIANRFDSCLEDVKEKLYTRDIYGRD